MFRITSPEQSGTTPLVRPPPVSRRGSDKWHLDEVFIRIDGTQHYRWCAVEVAHRELIASVEHRRVKYPTNRIENSHQPTRPREPAM